MPPDGREQLIEAGDVAPPAQAVKALGVGVAYRPLPRCCRLGHRVLRLAGLPMRHFYVVTQ
jgi:hypothetical protein